MLQQFRIDYLDVLSSPDANTKTKFDWAANGALRVNATIARTGWLEYQKEDGSTYQEYVSADTLFDKEHLDSIGGLPLTLGHPDEKINPENYKKYVVGSVGTKVIGRVDEGLIDVVLIISDQDAIDSIKKGETRQLSLGYDAWVEQKPDGTFHQVKRVGNHLALVRKARAGEKAKLHFDGLQGYYKDSQECNQNFNQNKNMATIQHKGVTIEVNNDAAAIIQGWLSDADSPRQLTLNLDGVDHKVSPEIKTKLDNLQSDKQLLEQKASKLEETIKVLAEKNSEIQSKLDEANSLLATSHEKLLQRRRLERQVLQTIPAIEESKLDACDRSLKELVILERIDCNEQELHSKGDSQIDGMFEAALLIRQNTTESLSKETFASIEKQDSQEDLRYSAAQKTSTEWNWILK